MLEGWQADAYRHLREAKRYQQEADYTRALEEARNCLELLSKDLLNTLGIEFKKKKWIPHDVSEKIPDVLEKLKQPPSPYIAAEGTFRRDLAWLMVLSKSLTAIKSFLEYGEPRLQLAAQEIFSFDNLERGRQLAEVIVNLTEKTCNYINTILEEKKTKIAMLKDFNKK